MRRILVVRLSAIGDVAMLIPILYELCRKNPDCRFTLLTQSFLTSLLINAPENLEAMVIDIKREEKNIWGLLKFAYRIRRENFDDIIDVHNVIRTKIIRKISSIFSNTRCTKIDKHRKERKLLLKGDKDAYNTLPSMPQIYLETFNKASLNTDINIKPLVVTKEDLAMVDVFINSHIDNFSNVPNIGFAPFASKKSKSIDIDIIEQIIRDLLDKTTANIILFGGSKEEANILGDIAKVSKRVISIAGVLNLTEEITLISQLKCMISMDSANMHFASMVGVPVISIWAGTNPRAGFLGLFQKEDDTVVAKKIDCSPCSIFGTNDCKRDDFLCCSSIQVDEVIEKAKNYLN